MSTEIQKIPGVFNLPADWPKVEFPDTLTGLLYDWHADDLVVGEFKPWIDRVSGVVLDTFSTAFDLPTVISEINGHKAVVFEKRSKLKAAVGSLPHEMTTSLVVEPGENNSGASRLLSGNPGFKLVNLDTLTGKLVVNSTVENEDKTRTTLGSATILGVVPNKKTNVAIQYSPGTSITGHLLGEKPISGKLLSTVAGVQDMLVGYNTLTAPSVSTSEGFQGKISRITIWARTLTDTDIEAVMYDNKNTYRLPN